MTIYDSIKTKLHLITSRRKRILFHFLLVFITSAGLLTFLINHKFSSERSAHPGASIQLLGDAQNLLHNAAAIALENSHTKTIAHRGFSLAAPENSLAAFELAAQNGTWGIETDVRRTLDGGYVCMHDNKLERTTNMIGKIDSLTTEQIAGAVITKGSHIDLYPNQKIPTLHDYLTICRRHGVTAVLDIKFADPDYIEDMLTIIKNCDMEHSCILLTKRIKLIRRVRELGGTMQVQYLVKEASKKAIDKVSSIPRIGIAVSSITPELVTYAQDKGLMINVWTYNTREEKDYWKTLHVDYVTSDTLF